MKRLPISLLTAVLFLSPGRACAWFDANSGGSLFGTAPETDIASAPDADPPDDRSGYKDCIASGRSHYDCLNAGPK